MSISTSKTKQTQKQLSAIEQLWFDYQQERAKNPSAVKAVLLRNALCEYYYANMESHVLRLRKKYSQVEFQDLMSQASMALLDAIERFDPTLQVKFETYFSSKVIFKIKESSRENDTMKRSMREKATAYESMRRSFIAENHCEPSYIEAAYLLGVEYEDLKPYLHAYKCMSLRSLEQPFGVSEGSREVCEKDLLISSAETADETIANRELLKVVMGKLNTEERLAIDLCFMRQMTMRQAGQVIGISESRVSQMCKAAMAQMRQYVDAIGVKETC